MTKYILNVLNLLLVFSFAVPTKAQWVEKNNGLYGGVVRSFAISGTNLFAGTSDGIFLSTDNGNSWIEVNIDHIIEHADSCTSSGSN